MLSPTIIRAPSAAHGARVYLVQIVTLLGLTAADTRVRIELTDGSELRGYTKLAALSVLTDYGNVGVPVTSVVSVVAGDADVARIALCNGDDLRGSVKTGAIRLTTVFGAVNCPTRAIRSIRFPAVSAPAPSARPPAPVRMRNGRVEGALCEFGKLGDVVPYRTSERLETLMRPYSLKAYWYEFGHGKDRRPFLLYQPQVPDEAGVRSYPIVVFLHGLGERGSDLSLQFRQPHVARLALPAAQRERPCYIFMPQHKDAEYWENLCLTEPSEELLRAVDALEWLCVHAVPPIDRRRIYVTGLGSGGVGAMEAATKFPGVFAAVVPICMAYTGIAIRPYNVSRYWHFCNRPFRNEGQEGLDDVIKHIRACGGYYRETVYEDKRYDAWTRAYKEEEMWEWMFDQATSPLPALQLRSTKRAGRAFRVRASREGVAGRTVELATDGKLGTSYVSRTAGKEGDFIDIVFGEARRLPRVAALTGDVDHPPVGAVLRLYANGIDPTQQADVQDGFGEVDPRTRVSRIRLELTENTGNPFVVRDILF